MTASITEFIIGAEADCHVVLALPQVSGRHAHCRWDGQRWWISDLDSTNGTSVDGQAVGPEPVAASLAAVIGFGSAALEFDALVVLATVGAYQKHSTVGADPDCEIVVERPRVSGQHARIYRCHDVFVVVDLDSTNGTQVDGVRLVGHPVRLTPGSQVTLGGEPVQLPMLAGGAPGGDARQVVGRPPPEGTYLVGAARYCACRISAPAVSAKHAVLKVTASGCSLVDVGSTNGTFVDYQPAHDRAVAIDAHSRLAFGSHGVTLATLFAAIDHRRVMRLIGAHPACDLVLDHPKVSAVHAAVVRHPRGMALIDLQSSNGVICDGEPIERGPLRRTSQVTIAGTRFGGEELARRLGLHWPDAASAPVAAGATPSRASEPSPAKPQPAPPAPTSPPVSTASADRSRHAARPPQAATPQQSAPPAPPAPPTFSLSLAGCLPVVVLLVVVAGLYFATRGGAGGGVDDDDPPAPAPAPQPEPAPGGRLPGQSAWSVLRKVANQASHQAADDRSAALSLAAVDRDMDKAGGAPISSWIAPEPALADHLRALQRPAFEHDPSQYKLVEPKSFGAGGEQRLGAAPRPGSGRFLVPNLGRIPVRDQAQRGTCAAFAGIGNIEHAILRQFPALKRPLDLSEQYFYYLSKPECQDGSCRDRRQEGSSYHNGFRASRNRSGLDIPLERDCRYRGTWRSNDVQAPLPEGCQRGAVDVTKTRYLSSLGDIVASLERDRVPIPIGTRLSDTWQGGGNRFISLRNSGRPKPSMHSAGHAYLIVGYRRVPNMPEEGGLCFYVKNSWGRGWGRGGYSCVTQAWLQSHGRGRLTTEVVTRVRLHESLQPTPPPQPRPRPRPRPEQGWRVVSLQGPDRGRYDAEISTQDDNLTLRGIVASDGSRSLPVALQRRGVRLYHTGVQVGRVRAGVYTVCTGPYDAVCALRYLPGSRRLLVHVRDRSYGHAMTARSSPVPFVPLLPIPGLGRVEVQPPAPGDALSVRLRFVPDGAEPTPELEIAVANGTDLVVAGRTVGSFEPSRLGLCTGPYRDACDVVVSSDGLVVLPVRDLTK